MTTSTQKDSSRLRVRPPEPILAKGLLASRGAAVFAARVRNMAKLFPADYPPYKRTTKMLIPYIL